MNMIRENLKEIKIELKNYIYDKRWVEERLEDIKERKELVNNLSATLSDMPKRKWKSRR